MKLRSRLQKLERTTLVREFVQSIDTARQTYAEQYEAYLRGQGPRPPDPPCPRGTDSVVWGRQMRVGRCVDAHLSGEVPGGEYLTEMGEGERRQVDGPLEALAAFARDCAWPGIAAGGNTSFARSRRNRKVSIRPRHRCRGKHARRHREAVSRNVSIRPRHRCRGKPYSGGRLSRISCRFNPPPASLPGERELVP